MQLEYSINLFPKLGCSFKKSIMYLIDYFVSTKVYCSISVKKKKRKGFIVPCLKHVILLFQRYFPSYGWETVKSFEGDDKICTRFLVPTENDVTCVKYLYKHIHYAYSATFRKHEIIYLTLVLSMHECRWFLFVYLFIYFCIIFIMRGTSQLDFT